MQQNLAPIVLFTYNRLWHTKQTIEALQKNHLANKSELFIYSDGYKNGEEQQKVLNIREYLKTITGFKNITIIEQPKNKGLANSIIDGVTEIINKYGKIIVLEDDMLTSRYFLHYMNENLNLYENDLKVASIHGYIYPTKETLPAYFFLKGADCWGWALWQNRWNIFEKDGEKLLNKLKKEKLEKEFNFNESFPYIKMLEQQIKGKNDSWAIRWYASAFLNNKLTLYPGKSYINNIGNDGSGQHCSKNEYYTNSLYNKKDSFQKLSFKEDKQAKEKIIKFFKGIK